MNRQRVVIYEERRRVLEGADLHEQIRGFLDDTIEGYVAAETSEGYAEDWDLDRLWQALKSLYPVSVTQEQIAEASGGSISRDALREEILSDAHHAYDERERTLTADVMRQVERRVMLSVLDRKWREHLYEMDYLKEGIGLRAMAQRDPLVEYQREGYDMFMAMLDGMKEESVGFLFNVSVEAVPAPQVDIAPVETPEGLAEFATAAADSGGEEEQARPKEPVSTLRAKGIDDNDSPALTYSGPSEDGSAQLQRNGGGAAKAGAGAAAGGSRRERRAAARQQGRGAKPPKSVKKR
jgi:preprotein translocase subunit SecA